ncbi:MAG: cytochrome C oxidase subunit I, partial [Chitinophagaceae bacterium]
MLPNTHSLSVNTSYKIVVPFYTYGAVCLLIVSLFLLFSGNFFLDHYTNPRLLFITHIMALGWGTMIIFGSMHQLIPVLLKFPIHSYQLAYATFLLMAIGIPLLSYGFYVFDMGHIMKWGARLVSVGILVFLINITITFFKSKSYNIYSLYCLTATVWLFITAMGGLSCVYNFTYPLFSKDSFHYLILHAHVGLAGWFLLLIIGIGSKLIPMFLISKYKNHSLLWVIYSLINLGLISLIIIFYSFY